MSNSKDAVRKVLDAVKADKRTSLTAPEGKLVCDAYGIPVPKEGVAKSAGALRDDEALHVSEVEDAQDD